MGLKPSELKTLAGRMGVDIEVLDGLDDDGLQLLSKRTDAELAKMRREVDAEVLAEQPAHALGWGSDGAFRVSQAQLRDPAWCFGARADLEKAGGNLLTVDGQDWHKGSGC